MTPEEKTTRCQHIKVDGVQCGSPALRGKNRCYFHQNIRKEFARRQSTQRPSLALPLLEDANAIQCALMQVLHAVATDQIDSRKASILLYGLQTACSNLKRVSFEPQAEMIVKGTAEKDYSPQLKEPEDLATLLLLSAMNVPEKKLPQEEEDKLREHFETRIAPGYKPRQEWSWIKSKV